MKAQHFNMANKKRPNKRLPKYVQDEIDDYKRAEDVDRTVIDEFVRLEELDFELTKKQKHLMRILGKESNKIITVTGPPGTSKTFIACYAATQAFLKKKCNKIILSKPTEVLSGTRDPGALPGTLEEKMAVYAESFIDSFHEFLSAKSFKHLWDEKAIEFKPAQFLRGRSLKDSFIIIDEFQNFDIKALKSIVTRLGRNSKIVFMGDTKQNDINKKFVAIDVFNEIIKPIDGCETFKFDREDIVREKILIDIIDRFEEFEDNGELPDTIRNT
jgi:phosphate starvation-inducible PhoH-like protein